jgi:hypothetical protein
MGFIGPMVKCLAMPRYRIRMINSDFVSCDQGEYSTPDAAFQAGIAAAVRVAGDSVVSGETAVAVEIRIEQGAGTIGRRVLSLSVAELMVTE